MVPIHKDGPQGACFSSKFGNMDTSATEGNKENKMCIDVTLEAELALFEVKVERFLINSLRLCFLSAVSTCCPFCPPFKLSADNNDLNNFLEIRKYGHSC